ncbi:MAG TPA: hypothetical protein VH500_08365 [Nitrososphaeraceae archaeon]|jgi:hypothetical protein
MIKILIAIAIIAVIMVSAFGLKPQVAHADGFSDGYSQARNDVRNGFPHNDYCSFDLNDAYCLAYKLGYGSGWAAANTLH